MGKIKNWKKTEDDVFYDNGRVIIYTNTFIRPTELQLRPTVAIWEDYDAWIVDTPKRTDRPFKYKKDAIKYAMKYMRDHPRG